MDGRTILVVLLVVLAVFILLPVLGMGLMMGTGGLGWMMGVPGGMLPVGWGMMIFGLLVLVGVVLLVVWAVRLFAGPPRDADRDVPLSLLRERYARGEIGREEYERVREDLLRDRGGR